MKKLFIIVAIACTCIACNKPATTDVAPVNDTTSVTVDTVATSDTLTADTTAVAE